MGTVFRFGQKNGQAAHHPCLDVKLPTHDDCEPTALSVEQQRKLAAHAEDRWSLLILTALATGLRQGELLGLR